MKKLEAQRPTLNTERHYTIGGDTEAVVHSNDIAEREAAITVGARRLEQASKHVRGGFDAAKKPSMRTEYIRAQLEAAKTHPGRNVIRDKGPSR
ncbi:MAG: hypothetical protein AAGK00_00555 [Pseudomonadota bacterium]